MSAGAASCRLPASQLLMRKIDRYILAEVSGPLLFGIGAFVIILVSVDILGNAFRLIFEQGIPAHIVGQAFVYQLPQTIALTIPMGTLFGVLTAMGRLSGDGEIVAMHAGGIGFPRLTVPVVALGVALSVATLVLNETIAPPANKAARRLLAEAGGRDLAVKQHYTLQIPPEGTPDKLVYAAVFDTRSLTLHTVLIIELRAGSLWEWFKADSAQWKGEQLILHNVTHFSNDGRVTTHIGEFTYNVGKSPEQAARYDRRINDMSMAELRQQIRLQSQVGPSDHMLSKLRQQYARHAAGDAPATDEHGDRAGSFTGHNLALLRRFLLVGRDGRKWCDAGHYCRLVAQYHSILGRNRAYRRALTLEVTRGETGQVEIGLQSDQSAVMGMEICHDFLHVVCTNLVAYPWRADSMGR